MSNEHPWPEDSWPTAEQWLPWFLDQAPDEQLAIAEMLIRSAQEASECFMQDHRGRLAATYGDGLGPVARWIAKGSPPLPRDLTDTMSMPCCTSDEAAPRPAPTEARQSAGGGEHDE